MWSLRPDYPAVPHACTFQAPPSVAEARAWPAEGPESPPRINSMPCGALGRIIRPSPKRAPSKRLPAWPWRGVGPRRGRSPHRESIDGDSPVLEFRRVAAHRVEVDALQLLRELPDLARAHPPAVDLDHR